MLDHATTPIMARAKAAHNQGTPHRDPKRLRCSSCALSRRCLPGDLAPYQMHRFEEAISRCRTLVADEHLFRLGDPFRSMFAVSSGCFKTYAVDAEGREQVTAFYFPSEIIGMDAIYPERHVFSCVALADSAVCVIPYTELTRLTREIPELQPHLMRLLSRQMLGTVSFAGDFSAQERLAAFLVMVSARLRQRGGAAALDLAMSRRDIANFLRLAPETVSRILARFQKTGLVKADRKHIALLDPEGLAELAACMNPYTGYGSGAAGRVFDRQAV